MTKRYELVGELRAFLEANVKPEHLNKVLERCVNEYVIDLHKADFYVPSYESKLGNGFTVYKEPEFFKKVVEYDPTVWNEYPKVKPQREGLYRIEYNILLGDYKECWRWESDKWCTQLGKPIPINSAHIFNIRFKPWDDEEGEK